MTMDEIAITALPSESVARARWFRRRLLEWSKDHARVFAWRQQHDPYAVLIAELMLRRTQARQVEPVYIRFLQTYPNPLALAHAEMAKVAEALAPLGLAWRADNFIPLARLLEEQHAGHVPCERDALLTLPGVGPYVADAVRVFACDATAALVDTNTVRVAGRFWGLPTHPESRRQRPVQTAIDALIEPGKARASNLALLDLAALICQPKTPLCSQCPVVAKCAFWREHMPQPQRKAPRPDPGAPEGLEQNAYLQTR
ncbi:MAG: hypothetical protein ACRDID_21215 [Ktedonobacterales bacterium]